MDHILNKRREIADQLQKSYKSEESTTSAPQFLIIGCSDPGIAALTAIMNSIEKSQGSSALNIFVDNNIDESKHQIPSQIDSIVLKGFSVEQLLIIKEDTQGKLEKSYIPELIDLIKADDSVIEEKYKKKIAALKERRDPEGIEKGGEGSRGGKVIGHTKSGKPIYESHNHPNHKDFTKEDHRDSSSLHYDLNVKQLDNLTFKHSGGEFKTFQELNNKRNKISSMNGPYSGQGDAYLKDKEYIRLDKIHDLINGEEQYLPNHLNEAIGHSEKERKLERKEKRSLQKSEELTPGEIERQRVADNLQKAYTPIFEDPDYLEKGKRAEIGEIRTWGGVKYVKHQDGWVTFNQKTGKGSVYGSDGKKKMDATEDHINHAKEHSILHQVGGVVGAKMVKESHDNLTDDQFKATYGITKEQSRARMKENMPEAHDHIFGKEEQKDPLKEMGYSDSDIEDFLDEYAAGGSKVPEKVREVLDKRFLSNSSQKETTKKPTLEEVDTAFSKVGKALAEGRDPDAITSLRDEAKKLGAAYGMSNEKIDEAISTSKKAHQGEHNQLTEAEKRDQIVDNLIASLSSEEIDVEDFLKKIGKTSDELSKNKSGVLDNKILFTRRLVTNFSGSWGVPNTTTTEVYHFSENLNDEDKIKSFIKDRKIKEKEHLKRQKQQQDNHDYRYQRPSTSQTDYGVTTLRKVMKDFEKRQKSSHGTMSSSKYNYKILKDNSFKFD